MASKTVSLFTKESAWSKQTRMLFGTNGTCLLCSWSYHNIKLRGRDSWRVTTPHVQSFVFISMLRGQPKTPPSGDDLAVLDYHLNHQAITDPHRGGGGWGGGGKALELCRNMTHLAGIGYLSA